MFLNKFKILRQKPRKVYTNYNNNGQRPKCRIEHISPTTTHTPHALL